LFFILLEMPMHRFWFAVRCEYLVGAFQAQDARAAACMAMLQWTAERDGRLSEALSGPLTIVIPAGGRVPEDCFYILTDEVLRSLKLPLRGNTTLSPSRNPAWPMPPRPEGRSVQ
jgi:hypothetical protein